MDSKKCGYCSFAPATGCARCREALINLRNKLLKIYDDRKLNPNKLSPDYRSEGHPLALLKEQVETLTRLTQPKAAAAPATQRPKVATTLMPAFADGRRS